MFFSLVLVSINTKITKNNQIQEFCAHEGGKHTVTISAAKLFGTLVQASVDLLFLRLFKRFFKLGLGVGLGLGLGLGIVLGLRLGTRLALGLRVGWVLCVTTRSYSN